MKPEPPQTSKMESFATIVAKFFILDVCGRPSNTTLYTFYITKKLELRLFELFRVLRLA